MLTLLVLAAKTAMPFAIPITDACTGMMPPQLTAQLVRENPDYFLPQLADAGATRVKEIAERGDWPCPFVALGDFDGDGTWDRAILLKHKSQPSVRLIAARHVGGVWKIELQQDWPMSIATMTLEPLSSGLYEQRKSPVNAGVSSAVQLDNLTAIQADHAGFSVSQIDGVKLAFFYQNDSWQHLPIDD